MEEPFGARRLPQELGVAALVTAACVPLFRLFAGGLGSVVFFSITLSLTISWLTRRYRFPALAAWGTSMAAMVWYLAIRFLPETLWGPFPSLDTFREIGPMVTEGIRRTVEEVAPVVPSASLLLFVAAGIWVTAWLAEAAAMWIGNPLLAISSTIPLLVVPGAVINSKRLWLDVGLWLGAAAWVVFDDERVRAEAASTTDRRAGWRAGPAARLAFLAALAAVALAPIVPGFGGTPGFGSGGGDGRVVFNPLVAIAPTLNRAPERDLFLVRTPVPTYMRLTSLDAFDGKVWRASPNRTTTPIEDNAIPPAAPFASSQAIQQAVRIEALAGPWLPSSYDPINVINSNRRDLGMAQIVIEDDSRALILRDGSLQAGFEYELISAVPTVSSAELDQNLTVDEASLSRYLALPRIPREVTQIAQRVTAGEPNMYRKSIALQDYLRTFTYDLDVAAGHSFDDLVEFLTESKRGYCEQFAASMAVMARALGIPSRVAIGFGYGDQIGDNLYQVTTTEAHAWPELFFPGSGWLPFEPTPRSGIARVPSYAREPVEPTASPSASPTPTESASPDANPTRDPRNERPDPADENGGPTARRAGWVMPVIVIGSVLVALAGLIVFFWYRRRRRWVHKPAREAVTARYVDFLRWCAAAGFPRGVGETPSEHAGRIGAAIPSANEPMSEVALLAEEALWAPPNGLVEGDFVRAEDAARAAIEGHMSRKDRLLSAAGWGRWRAVE